MCMRTHTHTHTCVQAHTDLAFPHFCLKSDDLFSELQSLPTIKKTGGKKVNKGSSADVPSIPEAFCLILDGEGHFLDTI